MAVQPKDTIKEEQLEAQTPPAPEMEKPSERWRKRLKERKPDADFDADPEALYGALDEYDQEVSGQLGKYKEANDKISDLFYSNPQMAGLFSDVINGTSPEIAFIQRFGEGVLAAKDDPAMADEFVKAQQAYMDKLSSSKKIEQEQEENMNNSLQVLQSFIQDKGMSDEEGEGFFDKIIKAVDDVFMSRWTPELLEIFYKGLNYETDVKDAIEMGRVEGRNEKIIEGQKRSVGDGLPSSVSTSTPEETKRAPGRRYNAFDY